MRNASLAVVNEQVGEMELLYDKFDIGLDGRPTQIWENWNIKKVRLPEMLQHAFFPDIYLDKVEVNRRMAGAIERVYLDICAKWSMEERKAYGLNQFVKSYCFGDGSSPNLFWYGAAWELSPQVNGEALTEVVKIFQKQGFTHDRKRLRIFEYW
jgi:hypothetical protein